MVALLEGADADSGTSVELGYAYSKGKAILVSYQPSLYIF
jgi:nucleoside 2-deoxyribosyltransferase